MNHSTATSYDIDEICELYSILYEEMAALQPKYIKKAKQNKYILEDIIKSDASDILTATHGGKIIGFALVGEQKTPPCAHVKFYNFAYLSDIVIHPEYRGRGVGTELINSVKQWARDRNLSYVELSVIHENTGAIELYRRQGFDCVNYTMRAPL